MINRHFLMVWLWGLAALGFASPSAPVTSAANYIKVYDARVMVPLAGVQQAQVFLRIQNTSDKPVELIGADCPYAQAVVIRSQENNRVIKHLAIPAKTLVDFTPQSQFLQLVGLTAQFQTGDQLHLKLIFSDNSRVEATAVAKSAFDQPHH